MIPSARALAAWRTTVALVVTTMAAIIIAATLATPVPSPNNGPAIAAPEDTPTTPLIQDGNTQESR
jgi:hypothetical protein